MNLVHNHIRSDPAGLINRPFVPSRRRSGAMTTTGGVWPWLSKAFRSDGSTNGRSAGRISTARAPCAWATIVARLMAVLNCGAPSSRTVRPPMLRVRASAAGSRLTTRVCSISDMLFSTVRVCSSKKRFRQVRCSSESRPSQARFTASQWFNRNDGPDGHTAF